MRRMYPLEALKVHLETLEHDAQCNYVRDMMRTVGKLSGFLHLEQAQRKFPIGSRVWMDNTSSLFTGTVKGHESGGITFVRWDGWKDEASARWKDGRSNYDLDALAPMPINPADLLDTYYAKGTKIGYQRYAHPDQKAVVEGWDVSADGVWVYVKWEDGRQEKVRTDRFCVSWLSSRVGCYKHDCNYWDKKVVEPLGAICI